MRYVRVKNTDIAQILCSGRFFHMSKFEGDDEYEPGEDADEMPFFNPEHPMFAPLQVALNERLDRKRNDLSVQLKYTTRLFSLIYVQAARRRGQNSRKAFRGAWLFTVREPTFTCSAAVEYR